MSGITVRVELSPELEALLGRLVGASERLIEALDALDRLVDRGVVATVTPAAVVEQSPRAADASDDGDQREIPPAPIAERPVAAVQKKWTDERLLLLEHEFPRVKGIAAEEALLRRINALPGEPIVSVAGMRGKYYQGVVPKVKVSAPAPVKQEVRSAPHVGAPRVVARAPVPASPAMADAPITNWSEERTKYLERAWSRGDDAKAIAIALSRFFGPPVSDKQVIMRAAALNLARGEVA